MVLKFKNKNSIFGLNSQVLWFQCKIHMSSACYLQKQSSGGVLWNRCSWKRHNIHRKTPMPESDESPFLQNISGQLLLSLSAQRLCLRTYENSLDSCNIFKSHVSTRRAVQKKNKKRQNKVFQNYTRPIPQHLKRLFSVSNLFKQLFFVHINLATSVWFYILISDILNKSSAA